MSAIRFRKLSMQELGRKTAEEFKLNDKIPLTLILDDIRSAHNVGAVFRSADAFLIEKIILCGITAQPPHREILKSALGATETVDWEYSESVMEAAKTQLELSHALCGLEQTEDSTPLSDFPVTKVQPYTLILGNEVTGVNQDVLSLCNSVIEIPQEGSKHSLNVSVAAGIAMWHFFAHLKA